MRTHTTAPDASWTAVRISDGHSTTRRCFRDLSAGVRVAHVAIDEISYELALGLPAVVPNDPFISDPQIKDEAIWLGPERSRATTIADRAGTTVVLHDVEGRAVSYQTTLDAAEPLLSQIGDPVRYPKYSVYGIISGDGGSITSSPRTPMRPPGHPKWAYEHRSSPATATT